MTRIGIVGSRPPPPGTPPADVEPIDLERYIPDFVLLFVSPIAVEVKPELELSALGRHARHIIMSGWEGEAIALGATTFPDDVIGSIIERDGPEHIAGPAKAFRCINCGQISILNADHGWRCRVSGCSAGNAHVGSLEAGELDDAWKQAGNRVQWKGGT